MHLYTGFPPYLICIRTAHYQSTKSITTSSIDTHTKIIGQLVDLAWYWPVLTFISRWHDFLYPLYYIIPFFFPHRASLMLSDTMFAQFWRCKVMERTNIEKKVDRKNRNDYHIRKRIARLVTWEKCYLWAVLDYFHSWLLSPVLRTHISSTTTSQ